MPPDIDRVQRIHDDIVRATSQTNEAIESIRTLFKDADQPQSAINLNELIVECFQSLQQEFDEHGIAARIDLDPSLPLIAAIGVNCVKSFSTSCRMQLRQWKRRQMEGEI